MAYRNTLIATARTSIATARTAPSLPGYYDNAFRVIRDGAPMRVFHKPSGDRGMIKFAMETGLALELPHVPGFRFTPSGDELARATTYRAAYMPPPRTKTDYYKGGVRKLIGGVPCRLARVGRNDRNFAQWADGEAMQGWHERAEAFRKELVAKGSYASAGVKPPA